MTVIPTQDALIAEDSAVRLARYARLIGYPECAFWGVNRTEDPQVNACREIWTKDQRDTIAKYLAEAQYEIEQEIGYFIGPRWVVGRVSDEPTGNDRYVDSQPFNRPGRYLTRWPHIVRAGVRAVADIALNEPADHTADPAVIGPIATTVTDPDEVHVYHPGTDVEIDPSAIDITGGQLTIYIPRCRMVEEACADNPTNGIDYTDVGPCVGSVLGGCVECEVDVKRVYNDPSTNAVIVWPHSCDSACAASGCSEYTQTACIYIREPRTGEIDVRPATYSGGSWHGGATTCCSGRPQLVRLNYYAGVPLSRQAEDAIIRLAHSKMPSAMCGCQQASMLWTRDREVPIVLDTVRLDCPFGLSNGAYIAWRFARSMQEYRGSTL